MKTIMFTGNCPQCLLDNKEINMRQNHIPFWECPDCQLQILIEKDTALILRNRGNQFLENNLKTFKGNVFLEETLEDGYSSGILILSDKHLKKYLTTSVESIAEFSFHKLVDSYVNYKFNQASKEPYQKQSQYFKIDFEDSSILKKLEQRDFDKQQNTLYAHFRLYRFLKDLLGKYHKTDSSWLPEMGMSKIEYYLCRKHFSLHEKNVIESSPILIKQNLKNLIIDIIRIIYLDETVMLSFDPIEMEKIFNEYKI